jgi:lysozyme family protein
MRHPYAVFAPGYVSLLSKIRITRAAEARDRARHLLPLIPRYDVISRQTAVPIVWLMAINERESGSSLQCYIGNGQRLDRVTTIVPKGRGPWKSFEDGCIDGLTYDHLVGLDWSDGWPLALYHAEAWNGFGPRDYHGINTGYLWSGTDAYKCGKYVSDGQWNEGFPDPQLGVVPVMAALIELQPSLMLPGWPSSSPWPEMPAPQKSPMANAAGERGIVWVQESLNVILGPKLDIPLMDDGSYGRKTRAAVLMFQRDHELDADGIAGPKTIAALEAALIPLQQAA